MELADIKEYFDSDNPEDRQLGNELVSELARRLGWDIASVKNLIETLSCDPQLNFIWHLWDEAFSEEK